MGGGAVRDEVICGVMGPERVGLVPCIRGKGHPFLHRDEYGRTWKSPAIPEADLDLAHALEDERVAHKETHGYLERALRMVIHYQQVADSRPAQAEAMPEPEPIPLITGDGVCTGGDDGAAAAAAAAAGEDARTELTGLALATLGVLARLGELLVVEDPGVGHREQEHLMMLAHDRLHRLERMLAGRATRAAPGARPTHPPGWDE